MFLIKVCLAMFLCCSQILLMAAPGHGFVLAPMLYKAYQDLKRDLPRYEENIKMSEATVNEISDGLDGDKPGAGSSDGKQTDDERVRDLKKGVMGELAKAKASYLAYTTATDKLHEALESYDKHKSPKDLKNAQNLVNQINKYRNELNAHLTEAQEMIRKIADIRRRADEKEWNDPNGKYQKEHQAIDNLWNWLKASTDPKANLAKVPQAGNWQQFDLETKETRRISISWEGTNVLVKVGKKTYKGSPGLNPSLVEVSHTMKTPEEARVISGPIPQKVLLQAMRNHDLSCTYTMRVIGPDLLEGELDGFFQVQWQPGTQELKTFRREAPHRVRWRAL